MKNYKLLTFLLILPLLAYLIFGYFGVQYLVIDKEVQEGLPMLNKNKELTSYPTMTFEEIENQLEQVIYPVIIKKGDFISSVHYGVGTATIYQLDQNQFNLRLENFETENGPDLFVYLTKSAGSNNESVDEGNFINLGNLKGNIGNQNYEIPTDINLNEYNGVTIWCRRFGVNFTYVNFS
jgi:hypothetical protein